MRTSESKEDGQIFRSADFSYESKALTFGDPSRDGVDVGLVERSAVVGNGVLAVRRQSSAITLTNR